MARDPASTRSSALSWAGSWPYLVLSVAWWLPPLLIGTAGEFPLNDDWAYAKGVMTWVAEGRLVRPDWVWAPAVPNVLWGGASWQLLGGGFESLRWSTLVAGWLGAFGCYALVDRATGRRTGAVVAALALAWNPIYLSLGFTFMTDVAFAAIVTWGLVAIGTAWEGGGAKTWAAAILLCAAAAASRNAGPVLPAALLALIVFEKVRRPRAWMWVGLVAVPILVAAAVWLTANRGVVGVLPQAGFVLHERWLSASAPFHVVRSLLGGFPLLGLFLAPVLMLTPFSLRPRWLAAVALGAVAVVFALSTLLGLDAPFSVNTLWNLGVGARTLDGADGLPSAPGLAVGATALGAALGGLASVHLALSLVTHWRSASPTARVSLLFALGYVIPLLAAAPFFDRWWLAVLPPLSLWLLLDPAKTVVVTKRRLALAAAGLAVLFLFSTLATHDMMSRHRARTSLLEGLAFEGVGPEEIDGGFEFNGLTKYGPEAQRPHLWVGSGAYKLSYRPDLEGYAAIRQQDYPQWLSPGAGVVYVHRRVGDGAGEGSP